MMKNAPSFYSYILSIVDVVFIYFLKNKILSITLLWNECRRKIWRRESVKGRKGGGSGAPLDISLVCTCAPFFHKYIVQHEKNKFTITDGVQQFS